MSGAVTDDAIKSLGDSGQDAGPLSLHQLQDAFQRAVMVGDDAILRLIPPNSRTSAATLLGVYRHAYSARLVDVAAADYPRTSAYLGADAFSELARAYLQANPSHTPNARWFASRLPEFARANAPYAAHAEIAELAALERAMNDAFDCRDDTLLTLDALRQIDPGAWGGLTFTPHACVRRLDLATNAYDIWGALREEMAPPQPQALAEPCRVIVWRQETTSRIRPLEPEEAMLWDEAAKGATFAALCELSAVFAGPDEAALRTAQALQGWLASGMISRAEQAASVRV